MPSKVEQLREIYERVWREDASQEEQREFIGALLEQHDRDTLDFHFGLLRDDRHFSFYCAIRAAFEKRGPVAEPFLIERFQVEQEPRLRGDALQLLGHMRSKRARGLATQVITADVAGLRYCAVIVLGWVGTVRDMETVLRDRLLHDPSPFVRGNAATAFRQVWYRIPRAKDSAIGILGEALEALEAEEDEDPIGSIVVTLQTIMKRRFGLREVDDEPDIVGDVGAAKARALRSVEDWSRA